MPRKHNTRQILENIEIIALAAEGKAIARVSNKVLFVPFVVPGDIVDVVITKKNKNYLEAKVVNFKKKSDFRIEPFCSHFGVCGGCKWQNLPYEKQLFYKQKQVTDQFERIGKIQVNKTFSIIGSNEITKYRNKLEFTFTNKRWLYEGEEELPNPTDYWGAGFHIPSRFDKVFNVDICYLQNEPSNEIRKSVAEFCKQNLIPFFDLRAHEGYVRNVIIRNTLNEQVMVIICLFCENNIWQEKILSHISEKFPKITSLYFAINPKHNDSLDGISPILYKGAGYLIENLNGLKFKISPKSFFQTNSKQACVLYNKVLEFSGLTGNEIVYDLYSGTGTIGLFLSKQAKKVIGIEFVEDAVNDARENAILNEITNATFFAGDVKEILSQTFIQQNGKPDVIIIDPPRSGIHKEVIETILKILPPKIVYVSCNPATQARDIQMMSEFYNVPLIQPVDMFPHTQHIENITLLILKK
ncbi:MAG: 23S rRNA (uracil(1939)-C(5))-methyltransferase RlmD [Bacteroidetes bacterium]|nr:23S rRNA (uracil(1939)-C(5))-methyltransferase RlmD [Bacteroidota bacterium]